jgi:hypothetical protein
VAVEAAAEVEVEAEAEAAAGDCCVLPTKRGDVGEHDSAVDLVPLAAQVLAAVASGKDSTAMMFRSQCSTTILDHHDTRKARNRSLDRPYRL